MRQKLYTDEVLKWDKNRLTGRNLMSILLTKV